jgi:hypothetical protein
MYWKDNWAIGETPTERIAAAGADELTFFTDVLKPLGGGRSFDWIIPVGQSYDVARGAVKTTTYEEVLEFATVTANRGYWGCIYWDLDLIGQSQWQALRDSTGCRRADMVARPKRIKRAPPTH